jgi:hypothetical protein
MILSWIKDLKENYPWDFCNITEAKGKYILSWYIYDKELNEFIVVKSV